MRRSSHLGVSSAPAAALAATPQGPEATAASQRTPKSCAATQSRDMGREALAAAMLAPAPRALPLPVTPPRADGREGGAGGGA